MSPQPPPPPSQCACTRGHCCPIEGWEIVQSHAGLLQRVFKPPSFLQSKPNSPPSLTRRRPSRPSPWWGKHVIAMTGERHRPHVSPHTACPEVCYCLFCLNRIIPSPEGRMGEECRQAASLLPPALHLHVKPYISGHATSPPGFLFPQAWEQKQNACTFFLGHVPSLPSFQPWPRRRCHTHASHTGAGCPPQCLSHTAGTCQVHVSQL